MSDSAKITVNYFCLGAFFIFIGSVLLCALGFTVVLPFEVTRSWPAETCTVINSSFDPNVCSCDEQLSVFDTCVSKYPCLQIYVLYVPSQQHHRRTDQSVNGTAGVVPPAKKLDRFPGARRERRAVKLGSNTDRENSSTSSVPETSVPGTGYDVTWYFSDRTNNQTRDDHLNKILNYRSSTGSLDKQSTYDVTTSSSFSSSSSQPSVTSQAPVSRSDSFGNRGSKVIPTDSFQALKNLTLSGRSLPEHGARHIVTNSSWHGGSQEPVIAILYRSWDDSFHHQCSLTECGDETWNVKEARRFKADWGDPIGKTFTCFYNPVRQNVVIIERTSTVAAVHAVLWPGLCLIGGITLWVGLCLGCWSLGAESSCKDDYGQIY